MREPYTPSWPLPSFSAVPTVRNPAYQLSVGAHKALGPQNNTFPPDYSSASWQGEFSLPTSFSVASAIPQTAIPPHAMSAASAFLACSGVKLATMPPTLPLAAMARYIDRHPRQPYSQSVKSVNPKQLMSSLGPASAFKAGQEALRGLISGLGYDIIRDGVEYASQRPDEIGHLLIRYPYIRDWLPTCVVASALIGIDTTASTVLPNILIPLERNPNAGIGSVIGGIFANGPHDACKRLFHGFKPALPAQTYQWSLYLVLDRLLHQYNEKRPNRSVKGIVPTANEQIAMSSALGAMMALLTTPTATWVARMQADGARYQSENVAQKVLLKQCQPTQSSKALLPKISPPASAIEMLGKIADKGVSSFFNPARIVHFAALYFISSMLRQYTRAGFADEGEAINNDRDSHCDPSELPSELLQNARLDQVANVLRGTNETCPFTR